MKQALLTVLTLGALIATDICVQADVKIKTPLQLTAEPNHLERTIGSPGSVDLFFKNTFEIEITSPLVPGSFFYDVPIHLTSLTAGRFVFVSGDIDDHPKNGSFFKTVGTSEILGDTYKPGKGDHLDLFRFATAGDEDCNKSEWNVTFVLDFQYPTAGWDPAQTTPVVYDGIGSASTTLTIDLRDKNVACPEPSTWFGGLAMGGIGFASVLRRRFKRNASAS